MYEEYGNIYKKYHEIYGSTMAVCLMVGSFYELYDIRDTDTGKTLYNIKEVTDHLGIQLTTKRDDVGAGKEALFAGFPDYTLHKHAARLTSMGWTVVVVDQVRDKSGKIQSREVARILSPATHVEAFGAAETPILTVLFLESEAAFGKSEAAFGKSEAAFGKSEAAFGLATLDTSTGITTTYQGSLRDDIIQHFGLFVPKELLVYSSERQDETQIRRQYGIPPQTPVHVRTITTLGAFSSPECNADYLRKVYSIQSMLPPREYLSLTSRHAELALLFLLQFAEEHLPTAVKRLQRNDPWIPDQNVICGGRALTQLQMSGPDSVVDLFSACITPMGKRDIRQRLLRPRRDAATIRHRLAEVAEAMATPIETRKMFERCLRYMGDLPRLHRRCVLATVDAANWVTLHQSYSSLQDMTYEGYKALLPPRNFRALLDRYRGVLSQHVSLDKALKASDDMTPWNAETYPEIGEIETQIGGVLKDLEALRASLCKAAGLSPEAVRLEGREKEPFGLRASTTTLKALRSTGLPQGASVQVLKSGGWIEMPALTTLNGTLVRLREMLLQRSRIVQLQACQALTDAGLRDGTWSVLEEWASHVDCTYAIAKTSVERGFVCPEIEDHVPGGEAYVEIDKLRHPLVEATGTRLPYVQHDVRLDAETGGWLVYGMNASGKSTLMKAVGIAVLLAQAGCYVPALKMRLRPFRAIYTRILNHDNLSAGLSSFAVEMMELRDILRSADADTLVLGDELCAGTETISAMSLVAAGIQWLSDKRSKYIFATHLHDLPTLLYVPSLKLKIWHIQVEYDPATHKLIYHRALMPGSGSSLYGLEVARAMDLPLAFLERAQENRRTLQGSVTQQNAVPSLWNKGVYKRSCELCGSTMTSALETHHIQPRADAQEGRLRDGTPVHAPSNLVVLCETCHDKHHAGEVEVASLVQTSTGPERISKGEGRSSSSKRGLSEEEMALARSLLLEYKTASLKALSYQLKQQHGITMSIQALSALRKRGL